MRKIILLLVGFLFIGFAFGQMQPAAEKITDAKVIKQQQNVATKALNDKLNNSYSDVTKAKPFARKQRTGKGVVYQTSFENGGAYPADWELEEVSGGLATDIATASNHPTGFSPTDGTYMIMFRSWDDSDADNRVKQITSFSTTGLQEITVSFDWLETDGYSSSDDRVIVQYSTDGATWIDAGTVSRYNSAGDAWANKSVLLPSDANNQADLYIAFEFISEYGDNCHLDNVVVTYAEPYQFTLGYETEHSVYVGESYQYMAEISNSGLNDDTYDLTSSGGTWAYSILDKTGASITELFVAAGQVDTFYVEVTVPGTAISQDTDVENVVVTSQGDGSLTDNFDITTTAVNELALFEDFEGATFLPIGWTESATSTNWGHSTPADWFTLNGQSAYIFQDINSDPEMLITPLLALDGTITNFDFNVRGGNGEFGYGFTTLQMQYSTDLVSWTDIGAPIDLDFATPTNVSIDLSALANGEYYFAFATTSTFNYSTYSSACIIDDILAPDVWYMSNDLGITSVEPLIAAEGEAVIPQVTIYNYGLNEQSTYTIELTDGASYTETVSPSTILRWESLTADFPAWTPTPANNTLTATLALAGDEDPSNNVVVQTVYISSLPIFEQEEFVNGFGTHATGADVSMLEASQGTFGNNFNNAGGYWVADDFTVANGSIFHIDGFKFFGYQTGSSTSSSFDGAYVRIYDGDPSDGGTLIHDLSGDNLFGASEWTNAYRITNGALDNTQRPIMAIYANPLATIDLDPGTYWISWSTTGTLASGPWFPHLQLIDGNTNTGNALSYNGTAWSALTDVDPQGAPFTLTGEVEYFPAVDPTEHVYSLNTQEPVEATIQWITATAITIKNEAVELVDGADYLIADNGDGTSSLTITSEYLNSVLASNGDVAILEAIFDTDDTSVLNIEAVYKVIESVDAQDPISVMQGTAFGDIVLPATVTIQINDGTDSLVNVLWSEGIYDGNTPGTYTLEGELELGAIANPYNMMAEIDITVLPIMPLPFVENFDAYPPENWTEAQGLLDDPTVFTNTSSSDWTADGFANNGTTGAAKLNIWNTNKDEWMFTPYIDLEAGSPNLEMQFDLALTPWGGTTAGTFGVDDTFAIIISLDTGKTWSAANELLRYDDQHTFTTDEHVTIDLSGYTGIVQLGFYGESTVSNADNDLSLDNIQIGEFYDVTFNVTGANGLLAGADVTFNGSTLITDATGSVTFNSVTGDYDYSITAAGYMPINDIASIIDQNVIVDVTMDSLYVIAFNADDGVKAPMEDVVISYTNGADIAGEVTTNIDGDAFVEVPAGVGYTYTATKIGYEIYTGTPFDVVDDTVFVPFTMTELPVTFSFVNDYSAGLEFMSLIDFESGQQEITFTNIGQGTINIDPTDITLTGADAGEFILENLVAPVALATGDEATVLISFLPTSLGTKTAMLEIEDNILKNVNQIVLVGEGHEANALPIEEDFESGVMDNWFVANGEEANQWFVGEADDDAENLSAMISNDGITNSYDIEAPSVVHFFMDVNIPAATNPGDYVLTFDWKGDGETTFDDLLVYLVDPSIPVEAGTLLTGEIDHYSENTVWQKARYDIPVEDTDTTRRIVFTWENDGSGGQQPPIAVDNIYLGPAHTDAVITSLDLVEVDATVTFEDTTIRVLVDPGTDLTSLTPMFETLNNGSVAGNGVTNDFTDTVIYTVTAEDGITTQEYSVITTAGYRVTFYVTEGVDPFEGIDIDFEGDILTTDADGVASIDVNGGNFNYIIHELGYELIDDIVTVGNEAVDMFIDMVQLPNPFAVDVTPDSNAIDIGVQPIITCEFDQDIWEVDLNLITVDDGSGPISGVTAEILPDGITVQINTPQLDWTTNYVITIPSGTVTNTVRNNEDIIWSFDTRDVSAPVGAIFFPEENAIDIVLPIGDITCQIDQDVTLVSDLTSVTLEDDGGNPITVTASLTGGNTVAIAHPALNYNTTYTVTIPSNTLTNSYLVNEEITWDFSTVMTTEPLVIANTPANGDIDVALDAAVSVEFDQEVIEMGDLANVTVADANGPLTGVTATINGAVIDIAYGGFEFNTEYTVTVPAATVSNIYGTMGNAEEVWTFTTLANNDATLMDLTVDGTTVTGFDPAVYVYNVVLPYGTTTVPTVVGTPTDVNAIAVVTPAAAIPGTTEVEVTAQDGSTILTYQVVFTAPNTDATLSDLTVDGTTVTGFDPATLTYTVDLPYGTTTVPTVDGTTNDPNATYVVNAATALPGTTNVVVTAEDGATELTYAVTFNVLPNDDATLSDLTVDGTTVTGFDPAVTTYTVVLPYGTTTVPTVDGTTNDPNATYVVNAAAALPGTTTIVVTAEDGTTEITYSVVFEVEPAYTLTFSVTDGTDPIEGASIDVNSQTLTTNASGIATIDVPDGDYPYTVTATGYVNATGTATVNGAAVTEDVVMDSEVVYYTVTFGVEAGNGTVIAEVDGTQISSGDQVAEGSAVNFTATPDPEWHVIDWIYNGEPTGLTSTTVVEDPLASDITVFVVFDPIGVDELKAADFINVYPNPTDGLFKVEIEENYQLTIYDFTGKVVKEENVEQGISTIDMSTFPSGIYMLEFRNDNRTQSVRLFIR